MNKTKSKKLSFDDLVTVSGGVSAERGDKTFQHEKYNKRKDSAEVDTTSNADINLGNSTIDAVKKSPQRK